MSRKRALIAPLIALSVLIACGGGGGGSSSTPQNPVAAATPTPTPSPTPNPFAAACGTPLPPLGSAYGYRIKVQLEPSPNKKVLNASPLVRSFDYCTAAGQPGTEICTTRREDDPQREACDHYISGISRSGRPGPDWYQVIEGQNRTCGGLGVPDEAESCGLKDNNQYTLDVSSGGKYRACSPLTGQCGVCVLAESTFGVIHRSPAGLCELDDE